ncbi:MAG: hypothetical protein ACTSXA_01205 [Candidatus Heimdallarchaeota archaeon]
MNTEEQIIDEDLDEEELDEEEEEEVQSIVPRWKDLSYIPNKKRFIILTTVFSAVEFAGMIILTYAFLGSFDEGLWDLGLFLMPPFTGVAIAYFVSQQKEAVAVSFVNAVSSIVLFYIIFISVASTSEIPAPLGDLTWYELVLIPLAMIALQVVIAFTIARLRNLYRYYGDATNARASDEAMIKELKQNRIERGLETPTEDEAEEVDIKEK